MDLEAMQLLNLSPIPELSEFELSTMLEQLSGLSDINGDLTDRNVEDIIKEAEDLLDKSKSNDINHSKSKNVAEPKEVKEEILAMVSKEVNVMKENERPDYQVDRQVDIKESLHRNPVKPDNLPAPSSSNEPENAKKHYNSPVELATEKSLSPGSSQNHIKSTIDSLKEFSTLVEKTLANSVNACMKETESHPERCPINGISEIKVKLINEKQVPKAKTVKAQDTTKKKNTTENFDKSVKLLNCFERLYQDRPLRLTIPSKPKIFERNPKIFDRNTKIFDRNAKIFDRSTKLFESSPKSSLKRDVSKEVKKKNAHTKNIKSDTPAVTTRNLIGSHPVSQSYNRRDSSSSSSPQSGNKIVKTAGSEGAIQPGRTRLPSTANSTQSNPLKSSSSSIDERLILKVLEEMEEIKDQVRKVGVFTETQSCGGISREKTISNPSYKGEVPEAPRDVSGDCISADSGEPKRNAEIKRLEEQVMALKEKYDQQMEKLEAENLRLREALNNKSLTPQCPCAELAEALADEPKTCKALNLNVSAASKESSDCATSKSCVTQTPEEPKIDSKEASAQTVRDVKSTSSQCFQVVGNLRTRDSRDSRGSRDSRESKESADGTTKETENKENVALKKKSGRWKPFSDINIHHLLKQKKVYEHEAQLMATVRGLQAEVTVKDKELRKLKNEYESLRRQMNKWTHLKEPCKKSNIGTQTVGLGPAVQVPYNPDNYEATEDIHKENEELRLKVKAMEEDLELLKEKRIHDLQELHKVHEEEMAKVVSKLETQSALTKHLHSLLVNR